MYGNNFKLISIFREFYVGGRNPFEILLQTVPHRSLVAPSNEKWESWRVPPKLLLMFRDEVHFYFILIMSSYCCSQHRTDMSLQLRSYYLERQKGPCEILWHAFVVDWKIWNDYCKIPTYNIMKSLWWLLLNLFATKICKV